MKLYRLKKEAVQFFKKDIATSINNQSTWLANNVDMNALEVVEDAFISYGHAHQNKNSTTLSGWGAEDGAKFHFTINFPSVKHCEFDKFSSGKVTRELMNKIQDIINNHYVNFSEGNIGK